MHSIVSAIVANLKDENFISCEEIDENRIYVETPLTKHRHKTYITFEVSDDVLRLDFKHTFGMLDVASHGEFEDVAAILLDNNGTFHMSSAYLAIELIDSLPYTSLQTYRTFLTKWPPEEIADQIKLTFYDIKMALVGKGTGMSGEWPPAIQMFG